MARGDRPARRYREADVKKLFALSYNSCALPGCEQRLADQQWPLVMAEICHIYGLRSGSARYVPGMSEEELNAFENLLLLCRNCHHKVDKLEFADYPAERLHQIKQEHEARHDGRTDWCPPDHLVSFVARLARTLQITLDAPQPTPPPPRPTRPPRPKSSQTPGQKIRLYDLAFEVGISELMALDCARQTGAGAQSRRSFISWAAAERIRDFVWEHELDLEYEKRRRPSTGPGTPPGSGAESARP